MSNSHQFRSTGLSTPHTVHIFDDDLQELRALICEMGGCAEAALQHALEALTSGDEARVEAAKAGCRRVQEMAPQIEKRAICLIALRAPRADDLREVIAALKILGLIVRIAEGARNIALRVPLVRSCRGIEQVGTLAAMGCAVSEMIRAALDSVARPGGAAGTRFNQEKAGLEGYSACTLAGLIRHMAHQPHQIRAATHLLFVARTLERMGEKAIGIEQALLYAETGESKRPSGSSPVSIGLG